LPESRDRFVLYEYLLFFWKKKWILILLPILGIIIALGLGLTKQATYVANLSYYIGNMEDDALANQALIKAGLSNDIENRVNIQVANSSVSFDSTSHDQDELKKIFSKVSKEYGTKLNNHSKKDEKLRKEYLTSLKDGKKRLETNIREYEDKVKDPNIDIDVKIGYMDMIPELERRLSDYTDSINTEQLNESNYQKPVKTSFTISEQSSFTKSSVLVGFVLGLFLSICLLTLWKYILDARRLS
jgi:hypothetical protein